MLGLAALLPLRAPDPAPRLGVVAREGRCELALAGSGAPCECSSWGAPLRRVLDLPLPLNRATSAELETLPGIGPARAAAIVRERVLGGPYASPAELERVAGIGPVTARRLLPRLFTAGPDPACSAAGAVNPG